jgi:hypothetical protein
MLEMKEKKKNKIRDEFGLKWIQIITTSPKRIKHGNENQDPHQFVATGSGF